MTVQEIIESAELRKPNDFPAALKLRWIAELDGLLALEIFLMDIAEVQQFSYQYPQGLQATPLVGFPHDGIYDAWMDARIDYENGEYEKYQNSMELYNAKYSAFVCWFASNYEPAQGYIGRDDDETW